jgi:hypothetical protein
MRYSFILGSRGLPMVAVPSLDCAEVPLTVAGQFQQAARWFFGPARLRRYLKDPATRPGWRTRVMAASAFGSAAEWAGCAIVPALAPQGGRQNVRGRVHRAEVRWPAVAVGGPQAQVEHGRGSRFLRNRRLLDQSGEDRHPAAAMRAWLDCGDPGRDAVAVLGGRERGQRAGLTCLLRRAGGTDYEWWGLACVIAVCNMLSPG